MIAAKVETRLVSVVFQRDQVDLPSGDFAGQVRGWHVWGRWELFSPDDGATIWLRVTRTRGHCRTHELAKVAMSAATKLGADSSTWSWR